jgi:BirA family biotin operon repressor/biotin-[acetyl-CoA-carboxylase] ligase
MAATTPTQSEILKYLKESGGRFVSGADLADKFAISRTGIWKHIQKLKSMGYDIESHPKEGYRLLEVPDSLAVEEILPALRTEWLGRSYHYLETISSTNDHALFLAANGAPHGTVVVAETQTRGRGRLSREWLSLPNRGIYMSLLLRDPLPLRTAHLATYAAALSLAEVLRTEFGLSSSLKWPNDILISNRKAVGLLTEMQSDRDFSRFLVVGIGINVNFRREELSESFRYPATSIAIETGKPVKRQQVLLAFLHQFEKDYGEFLKNGFEGIVNRIETFSGILGKTITVLCGDREIRGKALGFTTEAALMLALDDGSRETIWAGDVTHVEGAI